MEINTLNLKECDKNLEAMMEAMGVRIKMIKHSLRNRTRISCFSHQFPVWTLPDNKGWQEIAEIVQHVLAEDYNNTT